MSKNSLLFHRSWWESVHELPESTRLLIYETILKYGFEGSVDDLNPVLRAFFNLVKADMDRDKESYMSVCERNRNNGKTGGRPKNPEKPKKPSGFFGNPEKPKKPDNDHDNDHDLNTELSSDNSFAELSSDNSVSESPCDSTPQSSGNSCESNVPSGSKQVKQSQIDYRKFTEWFNAETQGIFGEIHYPLGDKRQAAVRARSREHGKEALFKAVKKAINSDFLKGNNQRGFTATFDWIFKPSNFVKIISGNYDSRKKQDEDEKTVHYV